MSETPSTPRVVVVGAGAAGSLTAMHLARTAGRRGTPLEVVLLDPAAYRARGTAFGTVDERHLLNVPAGAMSALPEEPGHFVAWRARQHPELLPEPAVFAPRAEWARYLDETLTCAYQGDVPVGLRHLRVRAAGLRRDGAGVLVTADDGQVHRADAVVLATGERPPGAGWAPAALRDSAFFVPDPWAAGALDVVRRDAAGPGGRPARRHRPDHGRRRPLAHRSRPSDRPPDPRRLPPRRAAEPSCRRAPAGRDPRDRRLGPHPRGLPSARRRAPRPGRARDGRLASRDGRAADRRTSPLAAARRARPRGVPPRRRQRLGTATSPDASGVGRRGRRPRARGVADPRGSRGRRGGAADRRRPPGHAQRRDRARGRLGGQLHGDQHDARCPASTRSSTTC